MKCSSNSKNLQLNANSLTNKQERSDGGISVYIPPKSVTVLFTCGTLTCFEIAMTS